MSGEIIAQLLLTSCFKGAILYKVSGDEITCSAVVNAGVAQW